MDLAGDHSVTLQFPQLLREHFLRCLGDQFLKFSEAFFAGHQLIEYEGLPFTLDDIEGWANKAFFKAHGVCVAGTN
jgi:hypothetical protein